MDNLIYAPRFKNGKKVPLTWPIRVYRLTNNIRWPVEDNVPHWYYIFDRFLWIFAFIIFVLHNDAENRYLRENFQNLDDMLTGMPTYVILIEVHIRAFPLGLRKEKFKKFLQYFYADIYIDESMYPKQSKKIKSQLLPAFVLSSAYLTTLVVFTCIPIYLVSIGNREPLYKMIPPVDYKDNLGVYLFMMFGNIWVGFIVDTMAFGEAFIMSTITYHLNARYVLMRQNFHHEVEEILKSEFNSDILIKYRRLLIKTLQENIRLNKFAEVYQNEFSFEIFIIFAFSALMLCALGFKVYTSPIASFGYIFWSMGKIQETLCYGDFGSVLIKTTDEISSMYYESNWETVIARSSDTKENINLMKLVTLSMITNRKAFNLTGLNFFSVSIPSVITILQGAGSYFTCLIALR